jgi:hypothetical protein
MALNTEDGGDYGYIYFSNLRGSSTRIDQLPHIEEKVKFSELKALSILGKPVVNHSYELDVNVKPGTEKIYIMKKVGKEQAAYKCSFYPRLNYESKCAPEDIKKTGKKSQIEQTLDEGSKVARDQYSYIMQHDNGFSFLFENLETDLVLLVKMSMTVENLYDSA